MKRQLSQTKTKKKNILLIKDSRQLSNTFVQNSEDILPKQKYQFKENKTKNNQISQFQFTPSVKSSQIILNKQLNNSQFQINKESTELQKSKNHSQLIVNTLIQLNQQISYLSNRVQQLQNKLIAIENSHPQTRKKKSRRKAQQIQKTFECPYQNCLKTYGSQVSLNLHIKLKHNGGTKTQREQYIKSKLAGQDVQVKFSLPQKLLRNIQYEESNKKSIHEK